MVVWEVWGHLRVSWEDELGGKGRGGGQLLSLREKKKNYRKETVGASIAL